MTEVVPPTAGLIEPIDADTCLLTTGGETLTNLAGFLGTLGVDFTVLDPPELGATLRTLAARFAAAAGG